MIAILHLLPGIALPTITGWLILRILEAHHPILSQSERWILGFVGGITFTMFVTFVLHIIGLVAFTFWGFLSVQLILMIVLGILLRMRMPEVFSFQLSAFRISKENIGHWSWPVKLLVVILTLWTFLKIAGGATMLMGTPAYHDDVFNNWNLRGKIFFETHRLTLTLPLGNEVFSRDGVSSYPPTVSMFKTWLATLYGEWNEGLINSIHILWYLAGIVIVFFFLRRSTGLLFALIGTYLLTSLPLYLIHGSNAYADVFLSLHILIPLLLAYLASCEEDPLRRLSALRLSAFFTGLLVFTKNEALLLYLPPLLLCIGIVLTYNLSHHRLSSRQATIILLQLLGWLALILIPWLTFKYLHHLPFGNAKAISGINIGWQPGVSYAIWVNTFFEGNWIFLWPIFLSLLLLRSRDVLRMPLLFLSLFLLIVLGGQILLYLFTSLSEEALKQTGLARGLVHLAPLTVFVTTVLLHNTWKKLADH